MKKTLIIFLSLLVFTLATFAVTVAWDPNKEPDLAGYKLLWGTNNGGPYPWILDVGNVTMYTVPNTNFIYMKTNYMVAIAYNTSGLQSTYSNQISFVVTNSSPPTPVQGTRLLSITP